MKKINVFKNASFYLFTTFIGGIFPLIALPIFTNYISIDDFGIFSIAQVYSFFVSGIANFGLVVIFEREFFEYSNKKQLSKLFYSIIVFVSSLLLLFGIITLVLKENLSIFFFKSESYQNFILLSFISVGIASLKHYYLIYFKNTKDAKSFALYSIIDVIVLYCIATVMVALFKSGIYGIVYGQFFASVFVLILLLFRFSKIFDFNFDKKILLKALKLSFPLTPKIFFGVINSQFDKYMIGILSSLGGAGIYHIGQRLANVSYLFMNAIQNIYAPEVYNKMFTLEKKEGGDQIGRYLTPYIFISIFGVLIISIFSEEIIKIMTAKEYHLEGSMKVVTLLSMLYGTYFFAKQPQLIYSKKMWISTYLILLGISLNILMNIPLINVWGYEGAALGTLIGGLVSGTISFLLFQKYYYIKWEIKKVSFIYFLFFLFSLISIYILNLELKYYQRFLTRLTLLSLYIITGFRLKILKFSFLIKAYNFFFKKNENS